MEAASKLTCGLCGYVRPRIGMGDGAWISQCRAVYCTGPSDSSPRLSGLGHHRQDDAELLATPVPRMSHQRYDDPDLSPLHVVHIRGIRPPPEELSAAEREEYSWGFVFHDACWRLLEQALGGGDREQAEVVDIPALWRILQSVPCAHDLPNWGHNYGGLYLGVAKDQARGEHFVLLSGTANLVIPSTFHDPFRVPEIQGIMSKLRIKAESSNGINPHIFDTEDTEDRMPDAVVDHGEDMKRDGGDCPGKDPFAALPFEIREMILTTLASEDACRLRRSSRAVAETPLTQYFFSSRFWPGHEFEAIFDGFLLSTRDSSGSSLRWGLDWRALYIHMRKRLRLNQICLGEKNRFRIWRQTIRPLARAVERAGRHRLSGDVKGQVLKSSSTRSGIEGDGVSGTDRDFWRVWHQGGFVDGGSGRGVEAEADRWRIVTTVKQLNPESWGDMGRRVTRAEIELPFGVEGVIVSTVEFFNARYITGLSFVLEGHENVGDTSRNDCEARNFVHGGAVGATSIDEQTDAEVQSGRTAKPTTVDLGYIAANSSDRMYLPVPKGAGLQGFHVNMDECGFRGLALIVGQSMESEYLTWAGEEGSWSSYPIKSSNGKHLQTISAVFDGFRMQALLIPK